MKLLKFTPGDKSPPGSLFQANTQGYTFGVEIWTEEKEAVSGKRYYRWGTPVYKDDGGEYITFENSHLKSILGKMYLQDIAEVVA